MSCPSAAVALLYQDQPCPLFLSTLSVCIALLIIKGWSNCQKICSWFSCLYASAVHSPVVFFPMYCLHIVAKGVRKERRFKGGHDASTFPIPLWLFSLVVLLDHSLLLHFEHPKRNVYFWTFPPLSFFLSFYFTVFLLELFIRFPTPVLSGNISKSNWMLPGQENYHSPAECWKDLAATGFRILLAIW